jgi:putative CocE/NonD family hydrolase
MKSPRLLSACLFGTMVALILSTACLTAHRGAGQAATAPARAGSLESLYTRSEITIPMRDGIRLDTVVFAPKDTSKTYPILLTRTPYGIPYVAGEFPSSIGPSDLFTRSGYIVAYQDVRGTHMSEGNFVNIRPQLPPTHGPKDIDESTDAYDTIDYLVHNTPNNNGRVGMWGISYPGFYADAGAISGHPALKAVSPQAPLTDWFLGDDLHHNGAFFLMDNFDWEWTFDFDFPRTALTRGYPQPHHDFPYENAYKFYLDMGPLPNANTLYLKNTVPYWTELMDHGNYDRYWQERDLLPHLTNIKPAMLTTGGWFDAEDFYGTLGTFRALGKRSPGTASYLALGPWPHGGWADGLGRRFGGLDFASATGTYYREQIEFPFFEHYLKEVGPAPAAKAQVFDTGSKEWLSLPNWPPSKLAPRSLYLNADKTLTAESPQSDAASEADSYISDPANPVPYSAHAKTQSDRYTPYMIEDQRFLDGRTDLLTYKTAVLTNKVFVAGPINVEFYVQSPQATDADFIVKIIDIYPSTYPADPRLANAEIQIRADVMRAKFRNSFEKPEPLVPGKVTPLRFALPDICHTFLPGHRIAIQIQSSWFPIIDRNPQRFEDIYHADAKDFQKAQITVLRSKAYPSRVVLGVR